MSDSRPWLLNTRSQAHNFYQAALSQAQTIGPEELRRTFYEIARADLYFFLCYCLEFHDWSYLDNDWTFDRCREIQAQPWGYADFWPRSHMKTTIVTVGYTLWESIFNPEMTTGIFSMTSTLTSKIANQMIGYLASEHMRWVFADVLWSNPESQSPGWGAKGGMFFKRRGNPREATIEFHSFMALPTGTHLQRHRIDDLIDQRFTSNAEMVDKALNGFRLMTPLRTPDGLTGLVGTRYDNLDAYHFIIEQGSLIPRVHYPTDNGEIDGRPLLMTRAQLDVWIRDLGPYQAACQMFQKPQALSLRQFSRDWIRWWDTPDQWSSLNRYIIVDPANSKTKESDFTAMVVVGLGVDQHVYLIDAVRDRLNPAERAKGLMELVRKYKPKAVYYEESGLSMDVHYLRELMGRQGYSFELNGLKAGGNKVARVETLQPLAMEGRLHFPRHLERVNAEGLLVDVMEDFLRNEWSQWPKPTHDDMLDALSRVTDGSTASCQIAIVFPKERGPARPAARQDWDPVTHGL